MRYSTRDFPEMMGKSILLPFNTGIQSTSTNNANEIIECIHNSQEYFSGRIPILGIESDINSSYIDGTSLGPEYLRKAFMCSSANTDEYILEQNTVIDMERAFIDCGNYNCFNDGSETEYNNIKNIAHEISKLSQNNAKIYPLIALGGDHSVTYPILAGIKSSLNTTKSNGKIGLIHFDAHPDLYDGRQHFNNKFSHASPFFNLVNDNIIDCMFQIGIRCISNKQLDIIKSLKKERKLIQLTMDEIDSTTSINKIFPEYLDKFEEMLEDNGIENIYISIDLDVLDPTIAMGTSHYEAGGLNLRELFTIIKESMHFIMDSEYKLIGCDIVEYNPRNDINYITGFIGSRLLRKVGSYMISLNETKYL